jgi:hypothetical protein
VPYWRLASHAARSSVTVGSKYRRLGQLLLHRSRPGSQALASLWVPESRSHSRCTLILMNQTTEDIASHH